MSFFEQTYTRGPFGEAVPNYGNPPPAPSGQAERAWPCWVCARPFRESQLTWFRGKPYGIPCEDYKDIRNILLREAAGTQPPPRRGDVEEVAEIIVDAGLIYMVTETGDPMMTETGDYMSAGTGS